ncbi:MAG: hypothetical protein JNK75_04055 [Betaproteobacteria bacterium]|nr:hypothetical protein [Betaproteobacteria bacterium]
MSLTTQQVAELLAGIVRGQQAIIDAIESESGGWKNTHLLPKLNTAANMRLAVPRLQDVPARVLLRSQGRVPMDIEGIVRLLNEASGVPAPAPGSAPSTGAAVPAATAESKPSAGGDDLSNFFDS